MSKIKIITKSNRFLKSGFLLLFYRLFIYAGNKKFIAIGENIYLSCKKNVYHT